MNYRKKNTEISRTALVAAIAFDGSGTTHIGKYVLNHSFMIPGLVATIVAVTTGLGIAGILY